MNQQKKMKKLSLVMDAILIGTGIIWLILAASMKDSYQYYFDSSLRKAVSILQIVGYCSLLGGGISLALCGMLYAVRDEKVQNPNLFACPDCQHQISVNAVSCPHCGWKNNMMQEQRAAEMENERKVDQEEMKS